MAAVAEAATKHSAEVHLLELRRVAQSLRERDRLIDRLVELHRTAVDSRDADSDGRVGWIVGGWAPDAFDLDAAKRNFDR